MTGGPVLGGAGPNAKVAREIAREIVANLESHYLIRYLTDAAPRQLTLETHPAQQQTADAGTLSAVWRQQAPLMKALLEARQPFVADFDWGGSPPRYAPEYVCRDRLMPAVQPERMKFATSDIWTEAKVRYSSGGSINTGVTWRPESVVDTPDRLEPEGQFHGTVTFRNVQQFKPKPGQRVAWVVETGPHDQKRTGEVTVDPNGLITIPGVGRGRIVVTRASGR